MNAEECFVVERRAGPRFPVARPARLRPNDWSATQVDILDISAQGFRGAGEVCFRIGALAILEIPGIGWVDARIVWQHLDQFGARFDRPIDLGDCAWTEAGARGAFRSGEALAAGAGGGPRPAANS